VPNLISKKIGVINMLSKNVIHFSVVVVLMLFSVTGYTHNNVVVIPLDGDDIPAPVPDPKIVFVSAEQPNANLGGVAGADQICQNEANASEAHPSLAGKVFQAWLFDADTDTFQFDEPTGSRQFVIPEGDLINPSGDTLALSFTHALTTGTGYQSIVISCIDTALLSECLARYDQVFQLETFSGADIFAGNNNVQLNLYQPVSLTGRFGLSNGQNCDSYSANSRFANVYQSYTFTIFEIIAGAFITQNEQGFFPCDIPARIMCVSQ